MRTITAKQDDFFEYIGNQLIAGIVLASKKLNFIRIS